MSQVFRTRILNELKKRKNMTVVADVRKATRSQIFFVPLRHAELAKYEVTVDK